MESKESTVHAERVADTMRVEDNIHHPVGWFSWRLLVHLTIIGLSLGLYGYDNSFAAPLLSLPLFIQKYQYTSTTFTARNLDLIVSVPLVGATLATFLSARMMECIGRKRTLLFVYFLLCMPGSMLQLFAPNLGALVVSRFWNYLGIGILNTVAPIYLSELAPAHIRGRAIGFCVAGVSAVGVIATTIVWATEKINDRRQYKIPLAIQVALPVVLGLLSLLLPESPVWDLQHNKIDSARRTFMLLRNNKADVVESEISIYQASIAADAERDRKTRFWGVLNQSNIKRTLTAGALLSANQVGGQILVGAYSTVLLVQSKVGNAFQMTVVITCLTFLGAVVGPILVDKVGRRPVALVGFAVLFILDIASGSLATTGLVTQSQKLGLAALLIIFGFFNSASFQSLALVLPAELATPSLREPTVAWAVFWSYVTSVITTFAVPQIMSADAANLGAKTAFIFAGCVFVTLIWAYFYIPETKARTVVEIDEMYAINMPMRKWRNYRCETIATTEQKLEHRGDN